MRCKTKRAGIEFKEFHRKNVAAVVHTSTVTVAVMSALEVNLNSPLLQRCETDFRVEWFSGSGAGGQHRNPTAPSRHA
jgi:protein subunit release factor A